MHSAPNIKAFIHESGGKAMGLESDGKARIFYKDCPTECEDARLRLKDLGPEWREVPVEEAEKLHAGWVMDFNQAQHTRTHVIDLKWSLWTDLESFREHDADGTILQHMCESFDGKSPFPTKVVSAPKKRTRFGTVVISKGQANVDFRREWDSAVHHILWIPGLNADKLRAENPERFNALIESIRNWSNFGSGESGNIIAARIEETIAADSLDDLMVKIDQCEERLGHQEKDAETRFTEFLKSLADEESESNSPHP